MTDKYCVKIIHDSLKQKANWFIDFYCPDGLEDIIEKAKEEADNAISGLSTAALYNRYQIWRKSDPIMGQDEHYFHAFLSDLVFNLGKKALKGNELDLYEDNCILTLKFIK